MTSRSRAKSRVRARNWLRSWGRLQRGEFRVDATKAGNGLIQILREQARSLYRLAKGPTELMNRTRAKLLYSWRGRASPTTREAQRRSRRTRQLAWSRTTEATGPSVRLMRRRALAFGFWAANTTEEANPSNAVTTAVKRTAIRSRARLRGWTRSQELSAWPVALRPMVARLRMLASSGRYDEADESPE